MSQFYIAENYDRRADYYQQILDMPKAERKEFAALYRKSADSYLMGSGTHDQYIDDISKVTLYRMSDQDLKRKIKELHDKAENARLIELERCRSWIIAAFQIKKEAVNYPAAQRKRNIEIARQWICERWPEYKAARKAVKGF